MFSILLSRSYMKRTQNKSQGYNSAVEFAGTGAQRGGRSARGVS